MTYEETLINEMHSLYDEIVNNENLRMELIKSKLPWYITTFFKITSYEISLHDTNIFIGVNFGKSQSANCYIKITPRDIIG